MTPSMTLKSACAALACFAVLTVAASAEDPDNGKGRFTMSPVEGGFLRLDKETGAVAMCARSSGAWVCDPVEDRAAERAPDKSAKLESENKDLKDKIKTLEEALENGKPLPNGEPPAGGKMQLPTEEEVDQAMDYVERIFKKFRDRMQKLEKPSPGPDGTTPQSGPSKAL